MADPQPAQPSLVLWRYRLLLWVALLPVFFLTLYQAVKHKDLRYLLQRLGLGYPKQHPPCVWLHAASVGEVQAVLPLIRRLQADYPRLTLRLSTVTPTGGKIARSKLPEVPHCYLPLDLPVMAKRFVKALNARCGLIMETELWPHLYLAARQHQTCLLTINGRISGKTLHTPAWVRRLYQLSLRQVTAVLAKSDADAERFVELGAAPDATHAVGNLKFAIAADFKPPQQTIDIGRPYVLAASTHQDEERQLAQLWSQLNITEYLLVIAPRHPYRSASIVQQLNAVDNRIAVRSKAEPIAASTRIYLADTLGELMALMNDAELVFMGGSLVAVGGHNILEPAMLGKPVIFGPYMHNFADETQRFLDQRAAIQVSDVTELQDQIKSLLADPAKRRAYGERANRLMQTEKDMASRYMEYIRRYCDLDTQS